MTVQKLFDTLHFLDDLDRTLGLQAKLQAIKESLDNLVQAPAQPQHQSALATALESFSVAAASLGERIPPSQRVLLSELGAERFFDPSIGDNVRGAIGSNAMTPSVARDFVDKLARERAAFLATVTATYLGIGKLGVQGKPLTPGSAEMAFLIPRDLFENQLGTFAKELTFINQLIRDFSEVITGQAAPVELHTMSSSVPTITIAAALAAMLAIGNVVNQFLDAWKKIEEIRDIRGRLSKIGMRGKATIDELTEEIKATVNTVVEESTEPLLSHSPLDVGRRNEMSVALKRDTLRLFGQIERGLAVEIRVEPAASNDPGDADAKANLENLRALSRELRFPQISGEPMLLTSGDPEAPLDPIQSSEKAVTKKRKPKMPGATDNPVESDT